MPNDDDRRMRLADLARFCIQIIPTELSNRVTADDGIELAKDLRLLAARVDAVVQSYGEFAERKIGGIDESLFKNQLLDALEGNAIYQIETAAKMREEENAEPDPDELRERMRDNWNLFWRQSRENTMNAKNQNVVPITESHDAMTPMTLLNQAVASGNIELAEKLMGLQERWEANQARKAFDNAMAEARAELPVILKTRSVDFSSTKGRTNYRYEDLAQIAQQVDPVLTKHGLTYRWRTANEGQNVTVTCIVSHRGGHCEENSLSSARDESGNKNSIQALGSAVSYLQRYTLKAALGLSASVDDDGRASGGNGGSDKITPDQVNVLSAAAEEVGADEIKLCKYLKVETLADLPASRFDDAMAALAAKHRKGQKS